MHEVATISDDVTSDDAMDAYAQEVADRAPAFTPAQVTALRRVFAPGAGSTAPRATRSGVSSPRAA